jgi:MYXO-CTERM domain-containing protein
MPTRRIAAAFLATALVALVSREALAASVCYQHPLPPNISDPYGQLDDRFHRGTDYVAGTGTPIGAVANGSVVFKGWDGCQGNVVVLAHNDGMFSSYSHMQNESPLAVGQNVGAGAVVGNVSMTGTCVTGPHLHLTISDHANGYNSGTNVDPFAYIEAHKTCTSGYKSSWVAQSYPGSGVLAIEAGAVVPVWIDMKNEGTLPWNVGEVFLGTAAPRDGECVFAGPDWPAKNRASSIDAVTPPGAVGRFSFSVKAPSTPGSYKQHLSALRETITWFGDDGGPADTHFWIQLDVSPAKPNGDGGAGGGSGSGGSNGGSGGAAGQTIAKGGTGGVSGDNGGGAAGSEAAFAEAGSAGKGSGGAAGKVSGFSGAGGATTNPGKSGANAAGEAGARPRYIEVDDSGEDAGCAVQTPSSGGDARFLGLGALVLVAGALGRRRRPAG